MTRLVLPAFALVFASAIWGFAFVAQKTGMETMGPFSFNAVRFAMGAVSLLPLMLWRQRRAKDHERKSSKGILVAGILVGIALSLAANFQQIGIQWTTAGKSAFITCLYIVFVPLIGLFIGRKSTLWSWIGSAIAVVGLYFLSIKSNFTLELGDALILICAFLWAVHILLVDRYSHRYDVIVLCVLQFSVCSIVSFVPALAFEHLTWSQVEATAIPLAYAGFGSVGVAYTLQVLGQKYVPPTPASLIFSLEMVFAALGGALLLGETLDERAFWGCTLIFVGIVASRLFPHKSSVRA